METSKHTLFREGEIITLQNMQKTVDYDCANEKIMVQFDGCGNISKYSLIEKGDIFTPFSYYSNITIDNINILSDKTVSMIGRRQVITLCSGETEIAVTQFLDGKSNAVFIKYELINKSKTAKAFGLNFGISRSYGGANSYFNYKFSECIERIEELNNLQYFGCRLTLPPAGTNIIKMVFSGGDIAHSSFCDADKAFKEFEQHEQICQKYIDELKNSITIRKHDAHYEKIKAMFISCLNCAISSYKVVEETGFRAFCAGINYQSPARAYFRDGYWTAQPLLHYHIDMVKDHVLTLARGVTQDGSCASAVISSNSGELFWGGHYDSPCYMIMLAYDYIQYTNDLAILKTQIGERTLLSILESCIQKLFSYTDETGLIYKPPTDRKDWADNVYREGYVTYIEALYYKAQSCMAELYGKLGHSDKQSELEKQSAHTKAKINELLWCEDNGYYVNYKSLNCLEDNLSMDSILTVLYDIADENQKQKILKNCQALLETRNNKQQAYGDWGVMSVFPFYKHQQHLVEKSAYPYRYHNGSDWPYLSGVYAKALLQNNKPADYPLLRWFEYSIGHGWFTPVEYYDPVYGRGSLLQAWSAMPAAGMVEANYASEYIQYHTQQERCF